MEERGEVGREETREREIVDRGERKGVQLSYLPHTAHHTHLLHVHNTLGDTAILCLFPPPVCAVLLC